MAENPASGARGEHRVNFELGHVVITANAQNTLRAAAAQHAPPFVAAGDWGDVDEHDRKNGRPVSIS